MNTSKQPFAMNFLTRLWINPTSITLAHTVAYGICLIPVVYLIIMASRYHWLLIPIAIVIGYLVAFVVFMLLHILIRYLTPFPIISTRIDITASQDEYLLLVTNYQLIGCVLYSPFWMFFRLLYYPVKHFYRIHGARIAKSALITANAELIDPWMIRIDAGAVVGAQCKLSGHLLTGTHMTQGPIHIEKNVTLGGDAIIMPNVRIQQGSVIGVRSVVLPNTVIGPYEFWAGIPVSYKSSLQPSTSSSAKKTIKKPINNDIMH